jgi:hypothetical protein
VRRSLVGLVVFSAVLLPLMLLVPPEAKACSCAESSPEEALDNADAVFLAEQVDRRVGEQVTLSLLVSRVLKGHLSDTTIEIRTGHGDGDCGVNLEGSGIVAVLAHESRGHLWVGSCSGVMHPDLALSFYDPLPEPTGMGPAAFAVSNLLHSARLVVLDAQGRTLGYGTEEGTVRALAFCPGDERLVEVVEQDGGDGWIGGADRPAPTIELRDLDTMSVDMLGEISVTERPPFGTNRLTWIEDLQCHDADGSLITFLTPRWKHTQLAGADLMAKGAELHVWDRGELRIFDAANARSAAVDPETRRAFLITERSGQGLLVLDLDSGATILHRDLPGSAVGWIIRLGSGRSRLAVLARHEPMQRVNWYYAEANRILLLDPSTGDAAMETTLDPAGLATHLVGTGSGFVAVVTPDFNSPSYLTRVGEDGAVIDTSALPGTRLPWVLGLGNETVLRLGEDDQARSLVAYHGPGDPVKIPGVLSPQVIATATAAGSPLDPVPTTTTTPPATTTTTVGATSAEAGPRAPEGGAAMPWWPFAVGGTLAIGTAVALLAWRRRHSD